MTCFTTGLAAFIDINTWLKWSEIISNIVPSVIGLVALIVAYRQLKSSSYETRNSTAYNIYHQYLVLCLEKPEFAIGMKKPSEYNVEYGKYCWFVSSMLFAFEQIIETNSNDEKWEKTLLSQLEIHKDFLDNSSTVIEKKWNNKLQSLIEEVISSNSD